MSERFTPYAAARRSPLRPVLPADYNRQTPTCRDANPSLINAALHRGLSRPSGNLYVLAASDAVRAGRPLGITIAGEELVAWRDTGGALHVAPGPCPHLGAALADAVVCGGELICRWHGLRLTARGQRGWQTHPAHDDGVLAWVRLDRVGGEAPTSAPILSAASHPRVACMRSTPRSGAANRRTSSPTASTRGTAHGCTLTRSRDCGS